MAEEQNRTWVDRYMLRMPDGMRDRIKTAAENNNRSMNAEIVATLEEKYPAPKPESYRLARLQAIIDLFDDFVTKDMSLEARRNELTTLKDMLLIVIGKMTPEEIERAQAEIWFPGELDLFEDWPPQGWRAGGSVEEEPEGGCLPTLPRP